MSQKKESNKTGKTKGKVENPRPLLLGILTAHAIHVVTSDHVMHQ